LANGLYVIVPSTKEKGKIGEFFLNIYFDCAKEDLMIQKFVNDEL